MIFELDKLSSLRTIPGVAFRLLDVLSRPESSIQEIADIVKTDPAITARIIKIANSAMCGGREEIKTLDKCILRMGKHAICCLALGSSIGTSVNNTVDGSPRQKERMREIWLKCVMQALALEEIARHVELENRGAMFAIGLLNDVSHLAILENYPAEFETVFANDLSGPAMAKAEAEAWGQSHPEYSSLILEKLGLPAIFVHVARFHELEAEGLKSLKQDPEIAAIVAANAGSALCDFLLGISPTSALARLEFINQEFWKLSNNSVDQMIDTVRKRLNDTKDTFFTHLECVPTEHTLLAIAMEQIAKLSIEMSNAQQQNDNERREADLMRERLKALEKKNCMDHLTGVYNREYFEDRLSERIRNANGNRVIGLLFIDIDHFKQFNDKHGHLAGDAVLQHFASLLKPIFRSSDVVARYGGEEFVVLIECREESNIFGLAERLRRSVETATLNYEGKELEVTVSIGGVYCALQGICDNVDDIKRQLFKMADKCLYHCKRNGRNQCHVMQVQPSALSAVTT
ncbi:MAG TPA: diguanylate cyclase [Pirellulaceae bacterium]|nr:diguanylate cyclase [Pirellulaceae bacterium]HMO93875.1 diguanylate cyclase [Pirellulaceae bacterium]HMP67715.1 diguanylate cyclase [Pirellulaceae bacterium]